TKVETSMTLMTSLFRAAKLASVGASSGGRASSVRAWVVIGAPRRERSGTRGRAQCHKLAPKGDPHSVHGVDAEAGTGRRIAGSSGIHRLDLQVPDQRRMAVAGIDIAGPGTGPYLKGNDRWCQ